MIRRSISNLVFALIKALFREREITLRQITSEKLIQMPCEYRLIGIRPSAQELAMSISGQSRIFQIFGFNGFTDTLPPAVVDQEASSVIHGRRLSGGEVGCARSHQLAYASPSRSEWTIFLEDDVVIEGDLHRIEEMLGSLSSKPTVAALEYGKERVVKYPFWKKKHGTYAYAVNNKALSIIANSYTEILCVADWPIQWIFQMQFLVVTQRVIRLDLRVESLIEVERNLSRGERELVSKLNEEINESTNYEMSENKTELSMISLYLILKSKGVVNPARTAFLASKSELYSG